MLSLLDQECSRVIGNLVLFLLYFYILRFKVSGELPLVHLRISDQKIKGVFELIDSIPLPQKSDVSVSSPKVSNSLYIWGKYSQ